MMKKIFISLFLSGVFMYHTNAQTAVEGNKFLDNWSIGISAGGTTPLTHHSFFGNMRPIMGIELNKQLTPVFGFGLEAVGGEIHPHAGDGAYRGYVGRGVVGHAQRAVADAAGDAQELHVHVRVRAVHLDLLH